MKKENVFKEKLYHHTIPVRDGLWEAIEAQLPPKKDQRIFPLFWFTLFSATLLGGVLMLGVFNQRNVDAISPASTDSNIAYTKKQNSQEQSTVQSTQESGSISTSADLTNSSTSGNVDGNSLNTSSKENTGKPLNRIKDKPSNNTGAAPNRIFTKSSNENTADDDITTAVTQTTPATSAINSNLQTSTLPISFLPQQDIYLETNESAPPTVSLLKPDPNCYKFSGTGNKMVFSVDVFAGPGFSPKTYEPNQSESSVYAEARKATENNQYAWSAGARINLQHRSGLNGRIGINYTQVGDVFDYTDSLATQSTTRIDSFFAADGTFLYTETSQVLILGTLIKKIHNTYRYLDIPLILGYEMPMGRSTLLVNVGPVFNLTSSHEGQILDPNLHPRSITEGDPGAIDVYKTNLGLSLYLGAGYLFPISDHFSGLIEPSFIYRLDPVTLDTYPLQERRHYAGLNLGIRYHFH